MAPRPMKWHIFNEYNEPLCWDQRALEFDEEWQAERFLKTYCEEMGTTYEEYCKAFGVTIQHCIFYYDDGHLDCSHKVPFYGEDDWEGRLIDVK